MLTYPVAPVEGTNMRHRSPFLLLLFVICMVCVRPVASQEPAAPPKTVEEAQAAYDKAAASYKEVFKEIEDLRGEFQSSDEQRQEEINAELPAVVNKARERMAAWTAAALELYKVAPNENAEVTELLLGMAKHFAIGEEPPKATGGDYFGGDQYEQALPIIKVLVDGEHPEKKLLIWGAFSAVCANDFDTAEKYLAAANEQGVFDQIQPKNEPEALFYMKSKQFENELGDLKAAWEAEQQIREAEATKNDLPRVKFTTSEGDIVVELFEDQAPIATANMINLVKEGFYDGVVFHRVLPQFMAQGGDPTGSGSGGPGYNIKCECFEPDARKHFRGTLSMAHAGRDTGGSQFFLCFIPTTSLDGRHTAFGRVVEGIEVLGKIQRRNPQAQPPLPTPDKIIKAEVVRDRGHDYDFEKLPER